MTWPLKILVLTTTFPRWQNDVVPPFVYHLSRRLQENGLEILVLAPHHPGAKKFEVMDGIKVYRFPYFIPSRYETLAYGPGVIPNFKRSILAKVQLPLLLFSELLYAMLLVRREKVDVINSHWLLPSGFVGIVCKSLLKTPNIVVVHGSDVNISKASGILSWLCSYVLEHSDRITVNSSYIKDTVISVNHRVADKVKYLPMGVDAPVSPPQANNIKERYGAKHLVFSIGRLIDWKGMNYLVMAMGEVVKKVPGTKLIIGGSGTERKNLERIAAEMGLEDAVIFPGYIEKSALPGYYAAADVFVLPSINLNGQTEALGIVLLEAMASGTPVIGSNVGGIPDIIEDGYNGFLVPEKSPGDLADRIVKLLLDNGLAKRFSANGLATVNERFLWNDIGRELSRINKECLVKVPAMR